MTMTLLAHTELASSQSSISFSSIDQTGTDLLLVFSLRLNTSANGIRIKINNSTSNFSSRFLYGSGSSAASGTDTNYIGTGSDSGDTSSTFGNGQLYFPNYSGASAKSFSADIVDENNGTQAYQWITAGLWNQTTPISSIEIYGSDLNNFVQYSSATLYKITKGSDGIVTTS